MFQERPVCNSNRNLEKSFKNNIRRPSRASLKFFILPLIRPPSDPREYGHNYITVDMTEYQADNNQKGNQQYNKKYKKV